MKKFTAIFLSIILVLSLCGCGNKASEEQNAASSEEPVASSFESVAEKKEAAEVSEVKEEEPAAEETAEPKEETAEETDSSVPDGIFEYTEEYEGITVLVRLTADAKNGTAVMEILTNITTDTETVNYTYEVNEHQIIMQEEGSDDKEPVDYEYDGQTLILKDEGQSLEFKKVSKKTELEPLSAQELAEFMANNDGDLLEGAFGLGEFDDEIEDAADFDDEYYGNNDYEGESGYEPDQTLYSYAIELLTAAYGDEFISAFWQEFEFDETGKDSKGEYAEFNDMIYDGELYVYPYAGRIEYRFEAGGAEQTDVYMENFESVE